MTRNLPATRSSRTVRVPSRSAFTALGFTCFRLVPIPVDERGPDESDYDTVELCSTISAMGAFMRPRVTRVAREMTPAVASRAVARTA
jgi:hypothetical protein